ncbi:protein G1-like7 [Musa acuminata AAA Group]|uniref:(wild Malaysian banana) hypothetical protein n=1 Tax=Musa acuminata subsp. malaccensis TaxID=214687 RepID=A0A804L946_MUSAM|nr:PREDICTED: protein G1-like7 [Musa acuminata subsp. malaccensis]CAG1864930.1 unnamed protein product [Musa acuminata subsp. malaccensis]
MESAEPWRGEARPPQAEPSRYESQKRRDWNTFVQYLRNHKPPLVLSRCSGAHVIEFLRYLDQFGKTKVHVPRCAFYGHPSPPGPCACPLRQAWGSLDALVGRLRAAYEESGGSPDTNPFAARAIRIFLHDVRESQAKSRGIPYDKKKRKRAAAAAGQGHAGGKPSSSSSTALSGDSSDSGTGEGPGASLLGSFTS